MAYGAKRNKELCNGNLMVRLRMNDDGYGTR